MDPIGVPQNRISNFNIVSSDEMEIQDVKLNEKKTNVQNIIKRKDSPSNPRSPRPSKSPKVKQELVPIPLFPQIETVKNEMNNRTLASNGDIFSSKHKLGDNETKDQNRNLHINDPTINNNVIDEGRKKLEDADGFVIPTIIPKINQNRLIGRSTGEEEEIIKVSSPKDGLIDEPSPLEIKGTLEDDPVDRSYEASPVAASLLNTQIHSLGNTSDMRWVFSGSEEGYIRRYDFFASMNGKVPLTVAQRHATMDVCSKSGVIANYWDNQILPFPDSEPISITNPAFEDTFSPVYSLCSHSKGLWCLSGLKNGDINLYTVRHEEGKAHHAFRGHTSTVSVIKTFCNEKRAITGSWDKTIKIWDLNTGNQLHELTNHFNQISSINVKPNSDDIILTTSFDGKSNLWDLRESNKNPVKSIPVPTNTPTWAISACFDLSGDMIFTARRNSTVEGYDLRMDTISRTLILPSSSGPVSNIVSHPINNFLMIGSNDNLRMWNLNHPDNDSTLPQPSSYITPFQVVAGHQTGTISQIVIDGSGRYMATSSGNRGWDGTSTHNVIFYEIKFF